MDIQKQPTRDRTSYIGSSDIAAIIGVSKYRTSLDVYNAKVNAKEQEDNELMKWGRLLEEPVLREFCRMAGIDSYQAQVFSTHNRYNFLGATADALTDDMVIEIKTTSAFNKSFNDKIPDYYFIQCQWMMGIHNRNHCVVPVLFGGQRLEKYSVDFDPVLFGVLVSEATKFWEHNIVAKVPPEPQELHKEVLVLEEGKGIEATYDKISKIADYKMIKSKIAEQEEIADKIKSQIFSDMGNAECYFFDNEIVARRIKKSRTYVITKDMPDDYVNQFKKTTHYIESKVY